MNLETGKLKKENQRLNDTKDEEHHDKEEFQMMQEVIAKNLEMSPGKTVEEMVKSIAMLDKTDQAIEDCKLDNNNLRRKQLKAIEMLKEKIEEGEESEREKTRMH